MKNNALLFMLSFFVLYACGLEEVPSPPTIPPTACFEPNPSSCELGCTVNFDANCSENVFSTSKYEWDFGDGTTATGQTTSHAYNSVGNFTVKLTVTNEDNRSNESSNKISITELPSQVTTFKQVFSEGIFCAGALEADNGNFIVYGASETPNFLFIEVSPDGNLVDSKEWGNGSSSDFILDMKKTSDNFYLITGHTTNTTDENDPRNYYIAKANPFSKNIEIEKQRGGIKSDQATTSFELSDGKYITLGTSSSFNSDGYLDFYGIKSFPSLDLVDGNERKEFIQNDYSESFDGIMQANDGNYIMIGTTRLMDNLSKGNPRLIKIDEDMNQIDGWLYEENFTEANDRFISGITLQDGSGFLLVGHKGGETQVIRSKGNQAMAVIIDNEGKNPQKVNFSEERSTITDVVEVEDGFVFLGHIRNGADSDYWLFKTPKSDLKNKIWERKFDAGLGQDETPEKKSLVLTSDGGFLLAGITGCFDDDSCNSQIFVVKTDANGCVDGLPCN